MRIRYGVMAMLLTFACGYGILAVKLFYPWHQWAALFFYGMSFCFFVWVCLIQWKILKRRNESLVLRILKLLPYYIVFKLLCILAYTFQVLAPVEQSSLLNYSAADLNQSIQSDMRLVLKTQTELDSLSCLIKQISGEILDEKDFENGQTRLEHSWQNYLAGMADLDYVKNKYRSFYVIDYNVKPDMHANAFFAAMSAFVVQYHSSLDLINALDDPVIASILNHGTDRYAGHGFYDIRQWVTDSRNLIQLNAGAAYLLMVGNTLNLNRPSKDWLDALIRQVYGKLGRKPDRFIKNPLDFFERQIDKTWQPVLKVISIHIEDIDAEIHRQSLPVNKDRLKPGDVLFTRSNWKINSVGMPGFWREAAIYVDADSLQVVTADLTGVNYQPLDLFLNCDYCAIVRPLLSADTLDAVIARARSFVGLPYDYELNFTSRDAMIGSEMVVKAFQPVLDEAWQAQTYLGNVLITPNDMVRALAESEGNENRQWMLVDYWDEALTNDMPLHHKERLFRQSWQRPKWTLLLKTSDKP